MLFRNQTDSLSAYVAQKQAEFRQNNNWEGYVQITALLVRLDVHKEWFELADGSYESFLNMIETHQLEELPATAKIYEGYAKMNQEKGNTEVAKKYFQMAEQLNQKYFDDNSLERAELYLSQTHLDSDLLEIQEGRNRLDQAAQILTGYYNDSTNHKAIKIDYVKWLLSSVFYNKAIFSQVAGSHNQSAKANNFSLGLRKQLSFLDSTEHADNYMLIGMIHETKGDYASGIDYLNRALQIYKKPPFSQKKGHAMLLNHLGSVYYEYVSYPTSINLQKGIDCHQEALAIHRKIDYKTGVAASFLSIANAYRQMGVADSFTYYYQLLNEFIPKNLSDDLQIMAEYYGYQGLMAYSTGDLVKARQFFQKQYDAHDQYGDSLSTNKVIVLRGLGFITLHLGDFRGGLDFFYQGSEVLGAKRELLENYELPNMKSVSSINELAFMVENIANVYKLWTDQKPDSLPLLKTSLSAHEMAVNMLDSLRARIFGDEMRNLLPELYYHVYANGINTAYRLYQETGEEQYIKRAWVIVEKGKALQLSSGLRNSGLSAKDGLIKEELDYRAKISEISGEIAHNKELHRNGKVEELTRELIELKQKQNRFLTQINQDAPGYFPRFFNPSVISLDEFQEVALNDDEVFVNYFLASRTLTIIALNHEEIIFKQTEITPQSVEDVHGLIDFFHRDPAFEKEPLKAQEEYLRVGYETYKIMIAPFLDIANGKSLILSPLSGYYRMSFEALLTEPVDDQGKMIDYAQLPYLFQKYPIQYAFSANTYAYEKSSQKSVKKGKVLGMAPVNFPNYENVDDLPSSQIEIEDINKYYPTDGYYFEDATELNFKNKANDYSIIHLATHGIQDTLNPLLPHLLFYGAGLEPVEGKQDNVLYLSEIYGKPLAAELVVLSACYTAEGKRQIGEGVLSVGRGFRYAGAKSILMSIWQVSDAVAPKLLGKFYELMSEGKSKRVALDEAKRDFLKNESQNLMHPYFWSTFVLYGDPVAIPPASGISFWLIGFLVGVGVVGIFVFLRRRKNT